MRSRDLGFLVLGVVLLLTLKYAVVGLALWDAWLHPERIDPTGRFSQPLLGLFGCKTCRRSL